MGIFRALIAIPKGLQICLFEKQVRSLAMWPWIVGIFSYFTSLIGVYFLHPVVLSMVAPLPEGIWNSILFYLAWFFLGLSLVIISIVLSIAFVMVFTAVFQTEIATKVLALSSLDLPKQEEGIIKEGTRTILTEAGKLLWILPLMIVIFLIGLIPIFTPFAFAANAWLLSYQFVDIVLEIFKTTSKERFRFARKNALSLTVFGASLTFLWAIPLLGLLLPPAVVAGAAWLIQDNDELKALATKKQ